MKKFAAVLLVLLVSLSASALASTNGTSFILAASDLSAKTLTDSDLGRATAVVLGTLDARVVLGLEIDKCSFAGTCYVGSYSNSGVDIFIPRADGGYYNIEWFSFTNNLFLYECPSYGYSDIVAKNASTTYYAVKQSDIQYVVSLLNN